MMAGGLARPVAMSGHLDYALSVVLLGASMARSKFGIAATLAGLAAAWAGSAAAQSAFQTESATGSFLKILTERLEFTVNQIPALGGHLMRLPDIVSGRTALLLLGIVVAGLAAEYAVRLISQSRPAQCLRSLGGAVALARLRPRRPVRHARPGRPCDRGSRRRHPDRRCPERRRQARPAGLRGADLLAPVQRGVPRLAAAGHTGRPHRAG